MTELIILGVIVASFFIVGLMAKPKTKKMTLKEEKEYDILN